MRRVVQKRSILWIDPSLFLLIKEGGILHISRALIAARSPVELRVGSPSRQSLLHGAVALDTRSCEDRVCYGTAPLLRSHSLVRLDVNSGRRAVLVQDEIEQWLQSMLQKRLWPNEPRKCRLICYVNLALHAAGHLFGAVDIYTPDGYDCVMAAGSVIADARKVEEPNFFGVESSDRLRNWMEAHGG